jgi:hypothetical protein
MLVGSIDKLRHLTRLDIHFTVIPTVAWLGRESRKNMLGGNFLCSRGSENARNASLIVPAIAHTLASASPCIKSEVVKAIETDPKLVEPTYINLVDQFKKLIHDTIQVSMGNAAVKTY